MSQSRKSRKEEKAARCNNKFALAERDFSRSDLGEREGERANGAFRGSRSGRKGARFLTLSLSLSLSAKTEQWKMLHRSRARARAKYPRYFLVDGGPLAFSCDRE